jgi:hypothetical protein
VTIRDAFLTAARSARTLLADEAVAAQWSRPSALVGFTVGGLAAHLATQVLFVPQTLAKPQPDGQPVGLLGHYARVSWLNADLDNEVNTGIREAGERLAAGGPRALVEALDTAIEGLTVTLIGEPADRAVAAPAGPWGLVLDDFLITRMMEIAVHSDDLAVSVGVDAPPLPPDVLEPVFALLTNLAVRRHGQAAVLRGLSRSERAPASVSAL